MKYYISYDKNDILDSWSIETAENAKKLEAYGEISATYTDFVAILGDECGEEAVADFKRHWKSFPRAK